MNADAYTEDGNLPHIPPFVSAVAPRDPAVCTRMMSGSPSVDEASVEKPVVGLLENAVPGLLGCMALAPVAAVVGRVSTPDSSPLLGDISRSNPTRLAEVAREVSSLYCALRSIVAWEMTTGAEARAILLFSSRILLSSLRASASCERNRGVIMICNEITICNELEQAEKILVAKEGVGE